MKTHLVTNCKDIDEVINQRQLGEVYNVEGNTIMVSIDCITYNHEDYIADAIESFLMQKTNFMYEILIHDDASTDRTPEIIKEYAYKYPNIIKPVFEVENQYSKGIKIIGNCFNGARAIGKYIALCEGDDYWTSPYKLQKQVDYMETHTECSMCFHRAEIVYSNKKLTGKQVRPYDKNCISSIEDIITGGGGFCATASLLYPKKLIENLPQFYMDAHVGDYPLQIILASKGNVYYIDEIMSAYRIGVKGSWTNSTFFENDVKNKKIFNCKSNINILNEFDKYTNFKYSNVIDKTKIIYEFQILVSNQKIKELKSSKYKTYYKNLSLNEKIKIYIKCYLPRLCEKLLRIKRNIIKIKYNIKNN